MNKNLKLKALIFGATGALGRLILEQLLLSDNYIEITIVVRRILDDWNNLPNIHKKKLNIILKEKFDFLKESKENIIKELNNKSDFDSIFCCLGTRLINSSSEIQFVEYDLPLICAEVCEKLNISHFLFVSCYFSREYSLLMRERLKFKIEKDIIKKNIKCVTIFKPGILLNRENNLNILNSIGSYVPFISKIEIKTVANCIFLYDCDFHYGKLLENKSKILDNNEILNFIKSHESSLFDSISGY